MELNEIYIKLINKGNEDNSIFLAEKINNNKYDIRLGIDSNKNPILLIPEEGFEKTNLSESNYKLNFLEIKFNQFCKINDFSNKNEELKLNFQLLNLKVETLE